MRVASYNIRKSIGLDRRREPARIVAVMNEIDADVVVLQEVDRRTGLRASSIPIEMLARDTHYQVVDLSIRPSSIGWHGNAILIRNDYSVIKTYRIDLSIMEPRGAVVADVCNNKGEKFRVVGAHLALLPQVQKRQVCHLLETVHAMGDELPIVVGGDFNEWKRQNDAYDILGNRFVATNLGHSYHSSRPFVGLDRIIVSDDLTVTTGGVHKSDLAQMASDHLPIWVDVTLNNSAQQSSNSATLQT